MKENRHFITRIEADVRWISSLIDSNREELEHGGEIIECDPKFSGKKLSVEHTFRCRKKRGSEEPGGTITEKVNVFLYFSSMNKARDDVYFREMFHSYAEDLKAGKAFCEDRQAVETFARKYMVMEKDPSGKLRKIFQPHSVILDHDHQICTAGRCDLKDSRAVLLRHPMLYSIFYHRLQDQFWNDILPDLLSGINFHRIFLWKPLFVNLNIRPDIIQFLLQSDI